MDPFREAVEIGRRSGTPCHLTHLFQRQPEHRGHILEYVEQVREDGLDVTFDTHSYS